MPTRRSSLTKSKLTTPGVDERFFALNTQANSWVATMATTPNRPSASAASK